MLLNNFKFSPAVIYQAKFDLNFQEHKMIDLFSLLQLL